MAHPGSVRANEEDVPFPMRWGAGERRRMWDDERHHGVQQRVPWTWDVHRYPAHHQIAHKAADVATGLPPANAAAE